MYMYFTSSIFDYILVFQVSIPAWFTADTRLGSLSIHLDTPQCFSAEMYSADLNITEKAEDDKVHISYACLGTLPFVLCMHEVI